MTSRIIISTTSMCLIDPINALCRVIERAERKQRRHTGAAARTRRIDSPPHLRSTEATAFRATSARVYLPKFDLGRKKAVANCFQIYLITSILTLPVLPMPIAWAAPLLRSIARPFTNGPRSLIRTIIEFHCAGLSLELACRMAAFDARRSSRLD